MADSLNAAKIHETAWIDEGAQIGAGTTVWHFCHVMSGARVGDNCKLGQNVVVSPGVILGNGVKVQNNVSIYSGVVCEDDVFLGPSCVFTNIINPRSSIDRRSAFQETIVKKGASIGANATILCGLEIGAYALVGAGSVVTRSVPPFALVIGNPARQRGWVSKAGHTLQFDDQGCAVCPETGEIYELSLEGTSCAPKATSKL